MTTLYGITNCDTVRKARGWLDARGVEYHFHDLRVDGLERARVEGWVAALGWETVINRRSTSWRALDGAARDAMDAASAVEAILSAPTLVRRPVLERGGVLHVGFKAADYEALFS